MSTKWPLSLKLCLFLVCAVTISCYEERNMPRQHTIWHHQDCACTLRVLVNTCSLLREMYVWTFEILLSFFHCRFIQNASGSFVPHLCLTSLSMLARNKCCRIGIGVMLPFPALLFNFHFWRVTSLVVVINQNTPTILERNADSKYVYDLVGTLNTFLL